eukprot:TRINITY_DN2353_c0_g1_i1.p1 TRINITY_DN2353_c0_g1~~TRINITY_DN2353_c0_g1_i1.p1  ORF type:complete len:347 (+),score=92.44 TRINITY_DN2353_c0_g1_i1:50-1090(+)
MRTSLAGAVCMLVAAAEAHICIIEPHQRGAMNITGPADHTCTRRYPSCGGMPAGAPTATYVANVPSRVHFQQNLNHWNQDKPGHFDLAVSYDSEATWELLKEFGDFPGNDMVQQTNFTFEVAFPRAAAAAVLRLRYISYNKYEVYPANNTDAVFYQCSDIVVEANNGTEDRTHSVQEAPALKAAACTTPDRWTATSESDRQHTKIWYDATAPIVRWDRTDRATGVTTSYVTNYTLTSDGFVEYAIQADTKTCVTHGADLFYAWQYNSANSAHCSEEQGHVTCEDHTSGISWGAQRVAGSDTCLPRFLHKQFEHITFTSAAAASFDPSIFEIPSYCKGPNVKKVTCH